MSKAGEYCDANIPDHLWYLNALCKLENMAVRAINLFQNGYFTSKSEVIKAVLSALILRILKGR